MLQWQTIDRQTLDLLKSVQASPEFSALRLVGGTGLALQIGHRKSVDIDLFGILAADYLSITARLNTFGVVTLLNNSENIHIFNVNGIKVDLVNYRYHWLAEPLTSDGLILAAIPDIAAMKLAAITNRGSKKDFIDLYFLLQQYTLAELLDFYARKYPDGSEFLVLKSLAYFADAEPEPEPVMLKKIPWTDMKTHIRNCLRSHNTSSYRV